MFDGKYHGHFDEALVELDEAGELVPEERGVPADTVRGTVLVPFNDLDALAGPSNAATSPSSSPSPRSRTTSASSSRTTASTPRCGG